MTRPLVSLALLFSLSAAAQPSAAEISRQSRERGSLNLLDLSAELKLTTTPKGGAPKEQVLSSSARKVNGKVHSVARFSQPAGVAGVAVLTVEGASGEPAEISLYLPKLRRVRKVARSDRGKAFMDTDFSYADLGGSGVPDAELSKGADATVDGRPAYVLKGKGGAESPYGEVTVWVDQASFVPVKAEYLDKEGKLLKRYKALKLSQFGKRTLAADAQMENVQTGSVTRMQVLRLEDSKLTDEGFTERALERG
jgi:hypothetical protein